MVYFLAFFASLGTVGFVVQKNGTMNMFVRIIFGLMMFVIWSIMLKATGYFS